jgi:hypothetical protein
MFTRLLPKTSKMMIEGLGMNQKIKILGEWGLDVSLCSQATSYLTSKVLGLQMYATYA